MTRAVAFPPGPSGVLLPIGSRRVAALGVPLYTASKRTVLAAQWGAWALTRVFGARILPGAREDVTIEPLNELQELLGPFADVALYRRRDGARAGWTFLAGPRSGGAPRLVKVRSDAAGLRREQEILTTVTSAAPSLFTVPRPVGFGTLADGSGWSAQEVVFDAPHRPCLSLPPGFNGELQRVLERVRADVADDADDTTGEWAPMHGDLTPWNLRRDRHGRLWLFDWEDLGLAPRGADEGYFHAALGVVRSRAPMPPVSDAVRDYWASVIRRRLAQGHPRGPNETMLARLCRLTR